MALHFLGIVAYQQGDARQAAASIGKAIAIKPDYADAHSNLGLALQNLGKLDEAVASYRKALAIKSDYAEAHSNLGNALKDLGKLDEAVASYRKALTIKPNYAEAHHNLGLALQELGKLDEAVASYRKALAIKPVFAEAHNNLGKALKILGKLDDAVASYRQALAIRTDYAEAHSNLGNALNDLEKLDEAVASYHQALAIKPEFAEAHNNLGNALKSLGQLDGAVASYHQALAIKPDHAEAHNNLGLALQNLGKLDEAVASYREALAIKPDFAVAHSNLIFAMNYDSRYTPREIFAESRDWDVRHAASRAARIRPLHNPPDPERRLRVGYVSPDFRAHPVSYFFEPLLAEHDRGVVEVFCYAEVRRPDEITARLQDLADGWCSTVGRTDAELAERIREDRIDVLVDLAGHTAKNRLLAFAERPAPVQVTWLGYGATTGMTEMDYRLTDAVTDPVEEAGGFFSETLARLPRAFFCYAPPAEAPEVAPPPARANGHVTFGSYNNPSKTGPEVVEVWARVLREVPGSRLLMKSSQLGGESLSDKFHDAFAAHGIAGERIEFMPKFPAMSDHLAAYGRVDIALDSFPYNGATTSLEAAWMGVPMIALRGDRLVSRMGASILTQLGLTDLVADTAEAYVEAAVDLARDSDCLAALRRELRSRMAASPLCDAPAFTRDMEAAFREMWRGWCGEGTGHE